MGCRRPGLRVVGYEIGSKDRYVLLLYVNPPHCSLNHEEDLYRGGGIISVTSRTLVDMLKADIPIELITGMLVIHAER